MECCMHVERLTNFVPFVYNMDMNILVFIAPKWFEGNRSWLSCEVAVCNLSEVVIFVLANVYLT